ncbi:MAG: ASCH domain-containing protein [Candidatus Micrarchaeota archaeon]|nr:ASCH domain-containing protein [Candidatus Micrarchaeota archaeon]
MAKTLHFYGSLPELILSGTKTSTWRVNDEKDIAPGDGLSLCRNDGTEFAKAEVTSVKETTFKELTDEDKEGHEEFGSEEEMYKTYSEYYKFEVVPETKLKIIRFRLA